MSEIKIKKLNFGVNNFNIIDTVSVNTEKVYEVPFEYEIPSITEETRIANNNFAEYLRNNFNKKED